MLYVQPSHDGYTFYEILVILALAGGLINEYDVTNLLMTCMAVYFFLCVCFCDYDGPLFVCLLCVIDIDLFVCEKKERKEPKGTWHTYVVWHFIRRTFNDDYDD